MRHVLFCVALGHTVQSMAWHASKPYFIMQDEVVCVADFWLLLAALISMAGM
jgi:hypothetical protein